jgi:hypothetical protein
MAAIGFRHRRPGLRADACVIVARKLLKGFRHGFLVCPDTDAPDKPSLPNNRDLNAKDAIDLAIISYLSYRITKLSCIWRMRRT